MWNNMNISGKDNRPVHFANLEKKVLCPNNLCTGFYTKDVLQHHFRIRHPEMKYGENVECDASNLLKKLHGIETRQLIEKTLEMKSKQVHFHMHDI